MYIQCIITLLVLRMYTRYVVFMRSQDHDDEIRDLFNLTLIWHLWLRNAVLLSSHRVSSKHDRRSAAISRKKWTIIFPFRFNVNKLIIIKTSYCVSWHKTFWSRFNCHGRAVCSRKHIKKKKAINRIGLGI